MDQAVKVQTAKADLTAAKQHPPAAPRIYYINPLQAGAIEGWAPLLDQVSAAGYSHVLVAPIFAGPSLFLANDFTVCHPCLSFRGQRR